MTGTGSERSPDTLDRLLAHEEIRQLAHRYALAVDSRDLDALVALFVPDVQVGRTASGREALREFFDRALRDVGTTILHVTNHVIDLDGPDEARGHVYCRGEVEVGDEWVVQAILYRDAYRRVDGRWRFVRREHLMWYGADVLQRPLGLPPADWPRSATGKGELPELWDTWREFWAGGRPG